MVGFNSDKNKRENENISSSSESYHLSSVESSDLIDSMPFLKKEKENLLESNRLALQRIKNEPQNSNATCESHSFEIEESDVWWHHQLKRYFADDNIWWSFTKKTDLLRWILTFVTAFLIGLVAFFISKGTHFFTLYKFQNFLTLMEYEKLNIYAFGTSFSFLFLVNFLYITIAFICVYIEPLSGGSGIPEVKCFLNGLNIPRLMSFKTLLCKAIGITLACSASLPLGKEGPMIHIGAAVASQVSYGNIMPRIASFLRISWIEKILCWKCKNNNIKEQNDNWNYFQDFRNDKELRDFVTCGAGAGVAAAFGAPIGGVLFSLEEGASFWSTYLTWRCFFCAMATVFFIFIFGTANNLFGHTDSTAMFSFGEFFSLQGDKSNFSTWELFIFILIGCFGGLLGAFFNIITEKIYYFRKSLKLLEPNNIKYRYLELVIISSLVTFLSFFLPYFFNSCSPLPLDTENWSEQERGLVERLVPLYCNKETEYNELASLYLTDSDTSIKQLFHYREIGDRENSSNSFSTLSLFLFFINYFFTTILIYGTAIPAGMFVPSLLGGACYGRLLAHILHKLDGSRGTFADSGTYALIGAASLCTGITRSTISLTIMILEATGDMQYVLPLMVTGMAARITGNIFTEGLYDIYIHVRRFKYLEEEESVNYFNKISLHDLTVSEVLLNKFPICLSKKVSLGEIYDLLFKVNHHCFPILDEDNNNIFYGTISRKILLTILHKKNFLLQSNSTVNEEFDSNFNSNLHNQNKRQNSVNLTLEEIESSYPNYPTLSSVSIGNNNYERNFVVNLEPYIDTAPYILNEHTSLRRAYKMFRTLGLRHIIIITKEYKVCGILTREDLVGSYHLKERNIIREFNPNGKDLGTSDKSKSYKSNFSSNNPNSKNEDSNQNIGLDLDSTMSLWTSPRKSSAFWNNQVEMVNLRKNSASI